MHEQGATNYSAGLAGGVLLLNHELRLANMKPCPEPGARKRFSHPRRWKTRYISSTIVREIAKLAAVCLAPLFTLRSRGTLRKHYTYANWHTYPETVAPNGPVRMYLRTHSLTFIRELYPLALMITGRNAINWRRL